MPVIWATIFAEAHPAAGADPAYLDHQLRDLANQMTGAEVAKINAEQRNPFPPDDPLYARWCPYDSSKWRIPARPLPPSYRDFLLWSDGGSFRTGKRWFDPFLPVGKLREYLLAYNIPQYMPGALPFAMDGGGAFYLFDLRADAIDGEYPIFFAHAGNLGWDDAVPVAQTFPDACRGETDPRNWE